MPATLSSWSRDGRERHRLLREERVRLAAVEGVGQRPDAPAGDARHRGGVVVECDFDLPARQLAIGLLRRQRGHARHHQRAIALHVQERGQHEVVRQHAQRRDAVAAGEVAGEHPVQCVLERRDAAPDGVEQALSCVVQRDASRAAHEQLFSQGFFYQLHAARERRGAHVQARRRGRQVLGLGDGAERRDPGPDPLELLGGVVLHSVLAFLAVSTARSSARGL